MSITVPIKSIDLRQGSAIAIHAMTWLDRVITDELFADLSVTSEQFFVKAGI